MSLCYQYVWYAKQIVLHLCPYLKDSTKTDSHLLDCGKQKGGEVELKSRAEGRVGHNGGVAQGVDGTGVHEQGTSW